MFPSHDRQVAGKNKEETQSIVEKRLWEVKQEMFKGWKGFIDTANQLWDQMVKWQPTEKTTIDGKEVEIPKYFEIEDDKFGKIVFGEESFQGSMMTADRKSTRLNSSHRSLSRMPSSA